MSDVIYNAVDFDDPELLREMELCEQRYHAGAMTQAQARLEVVEILRKYSTQHDSLGATLEHINKVEDGKAAKLN